MAPTRTAIVTGAAGAIGKAIARGLARAGFEVVAVAREAAAAERLGDELAREVPGARVRGEAVDLALRTEIAAFAARWRGPLHVLVNNAATAPRRRALTAEGIEAQLAVNVLSYLRMARAFEGALALGAPARIVNVASYWAGDLVLDDLQFTRRAYDNDAAYRQSKQANRMLTVAQAERLAPRGIAVVACHPGDVRSKLSLDLGFGGAQSPDEGAETPLWLATIDSAGLATGRYFARRRAERCPFGEDRAAVEALWEACERLD